MYHQVVIAAVINTAQRRTLAATATQNGRHFEYHAPIARDDSIVHRQYVIVIT
jgi:hypothetical protein